MYDFWYDYGELIMGILIIVAIVVASIIGVTKFDEAKCIAKTEGIGFPHRWSWIGGCLIEVNPDQWIPLESYYFKQE